MKRRTLLVGGGLALVGAAIGNEVRRMGSDESYAAAQAQLRAILQRRPELPGLVRYATLAPNGHNTQPWRFRAGAGQVGIAPDTSRRTPAVDPDDHHLYVSLGCAAETLGIAAARFGLGGDLEFDGANDRLTYRFGTTRAADAQLFDAIPRRQSTRAAFGARKASSAELASLRRAAAVPGVHLAILTDPRAIAAVRDLVVEGNSAQMADPAFIAELRRWLRFNHRQAVATGDGLFSACSGNPVAPSWLGPRLFDLAFKPEPENARLAEQVQASAGIAIFVGERADPAHWIRVGQACQRFSLQATALGMTLAYVNQPVEVPRLRAKAAALAGAPGVRPDLVLRFGFGPVLPYSLRRPVAQVLG